MITLQSLSARFWTGRNDQFSAVTDSGVVSVNLVGDNSAFLFADLKGGAFVTAVRLDSR